jgi:hypothetical protein
MASIGLSIASDPLTVYLDISTQGIAAQETTEGTGFASSYMKYVMGDFVAKNYGHGSGSLDSEIVFNGLINFKKIHPIGDDWKDIDCSLIQLNESTKTVYAPMRMALGTGYYAANPVNFNSLIKEQTQGTAYNSFSSMQHEVEYAHGLDKDLNLNLESCSTHIYDPKWQRVQNITLKLNEDVTDGKIHVGVLQGASNVLSPKNAIVTGTVKPSLYAAYKSKYNAIDIDENYYGNYHIERNYDLSSPAILQEEYDDWLPCCSDGYMNMEPSYKKGPTGFGSDLMKVFDCTCPATYSHAEFQIAR